MCYYDSTNNGLIDARFFYLTLRVIKEHFPYFGLGVEQDAMYKPLSMKAINEIPVNWMILLYFAIPEYCGVMVMEGHLLDSWVRLIERGVYYKQCMESRLI